MNSASYDLIPVRHRRRTGAKVLVAFALLAGLTPAITALSAVAPPPAAASHYRANQISWHSDGSNTAEFHVTGSWRKTAYFGGTPTMGATFFPTRVNFGDGSSVSPPFEVTSWDMANDVVSGEAHVDHTYTTSGPYTAFLADCCRISPPAHRNNPDGDVRLESLVDFAGTTASPVSQISPIVDCGLNSMCRFQVPSTDADGQARRFRFATGSEAGFGFDQPAGATINATSGQYSWDTTGANLNSNGQSYFSTQVIIENVVGQQVVATTPVDFFIRVTESPNHPPDWDAPTPADATRLTVAPGQTTTFNVAAADPDAADTVTLSLLGLPQDAAFTAAPGNPATGTFT